MSTTTVAPESKISEFTEFPHLDEIVKRNKTPGVKLMKAMDAFKKITVEDRRNEYEVWEVAFENAERIDNEK